MLAETLVTPEDEAGPGSGHEAAGYCETCFIVPQLGRGSDYI